jgi:hypothetical protein
MKRGLAIGALLAFVLTASPSSEARPGGGSSFRSSSGSSGSSSSRSSSGSSGSYRSSSGSSGSSRSSSSGTESFDPWLCRVGDARTRVTTWSVGGASLYGVVPPRPDHTRVTGSTENEATFLAFSFLGIIGFVASAMFASAILLVIRIARRPTGWTTRVAPPDTSLPNGRRALEELRALDPDFSLVLFDDFLYALYTEVHVARGAGRLAMFAPYLRPGARSTLSSLGAAPVSTVVVGAMRLVEASVDASRGASVTVEFEANYTEGAASYYACERWRLSRGAAARSRPPDKVRVFGCPSCGAPLDRIVGSTCQYCQRVVDNGSFDWVVDSIEVVQREARPPMLTGTTEEVGTDFPTVFDPARDVRLAELTHRDHTFDANLLFARVGIIFQNMQVAWSSLAWERARPFLSDNLWQAQSYWLEAYRKSGLRNMNENARIVRLELVRVTADRWFDAITLRVHATGFDFTVDSANTIVGGSRSAERAYTEYWTLIRSATAKGPARTDPVCPSCGGPLAINMAGQCNHCQVKVTAGEFDWVLSRIEQDDTYAG